MRGYSRERAESALSVSFKLREGLSRIEDGPFLTQKRSFGVPKVQVKAAFCVWPDRALKKRSTLTVISTALGEA